MNLLNEIVEWLNTNHDLAYSFIRIFLGIALFMRGYILLFDPTVISELAGENKLNWWYSYVTMIHLVGGLLLALGLLTRVAALLQIPILAGAVFLIHFKQGLMARGQSLELSILVLVLLIVYSLFGSSSLSIDNYNSKKKSTVNNITNS